MNVKVRLAKTSNRSKTASRTVCAAVALATLGACEQIDPAANYVERPVNDIYNEGVDLLKIREYQSAAETFDDVERQHPYSVWATKAQIMSAYAYYQDNNYQEAISSLDRFIQLHPTNKDVAYAYYLRGLSYYERIVDITRDQAITEKALTHLSEVVTRFPDSEYARDAELKLDLAYDHLAGKEMEIGRFYHNRDHYLAAINRYRVVIDKYQTTTHVPEALHRLTEAYLALGLTREARTTAAILGYNFPGSEWYSDSYGILTGEEVSSTREEKAWYDGLVFW